jgi:DNA-binding NtrC family response regulator
MAEGHILIVEDRDSLRGLLRRALQAEGYRITEAADGGVAARLLAGGSFDLVLTDLKLPVASGLEVVATSRRLHPRTPVLVMTAYGTVSAAVEAMKLGALDFLEKPVEVDDLLRLAKAALGEPEPEAVFAPPGCPPIVGRHPSLRAALRLLQRVAPTDSTVLLTGESGTGKELFARCLHGTSRRREGTFVAVNCAALPASLMENELFGHEKGAFTGADRRQAGRFERAHGGTLFLDEIGELPLALQAKVLRVLEDGTFDRVGGTAPARSDARLVVATNRDLSAMVAAGEFRGDLYYRLDVFPIHMPPLRDRLEDLPALVQHLLHKLSHHHGQKAPFATPEALEHLGRYSWPGNVRELANVLERAVILCDGDRLQPADLLLTREALPTGEAAEVRQALEASGGDKHLAAQSLGISYSTLQRRIRRYDLEGFPQYRP